MGQRNKMNRNNTSPAKRKKLIGGGKRNVVNLRGNQLGKLDEESDQIKIPKDPLDQEGYGTSREYRHY